MAPPAGKWSFALGSFVCAGGALVLLSLRLFLDTPGLGVVGFLILTITVPSAFLALALGLFIGVAGFALETGRRRALALLGVIVCGGIFAAAWILYVQA
ncbi:MAG: hypothetical protein U0793_12015 [Gemmataceae bacterium]